MNENYRVRKCLASFQKISYAESEHESSTPVLFDCSLGVNPFGYSESVARAAAEPADFNAYPDPSASGLCQAVARYWSDVARVGAENVRVYGGSMTALEALCKVFIDDGSRALGYAPQFVDFINCVKGMGGDYEAVDMKGNPGWRFDAEALAGAISGEHMVVYLDNPNNPTGQLISLNELEKVVARAAELRVAVIVDEAYGEFADKRCSAISLLDKYTNLVVVRTFSKGYGLAGVRAGYVVAHRKIVEYCNQVGNPFLITDMAARLAAAALDDDGFLEYSRAQVAAIKRQLIEGLTMLECRETDMSVPIMTLVDPRGRDLYALLRERGVKTEAGTDLGIGESAVRLRVNREPEKLLEILNTL